MSILTHHKCASTFVGQYLARVCELNGLAMFSSHHGTAQPDETRDISFLSNAIYRRIAGAVTQSSLHIIRNPLDVIVSAYYSHRATHNTDGWAELSQQRGLLAALPKDDGIFLTLAFLERNDFYPRTPGPLAALRSWRFDDIRIRTVRMEDMVAEVNSVLGAFLIENNTAVVTLPASGEFSFERITGGRTPGKIDETSHFRSGLPGGWRNELPPSIVTYVRVHFRSLLERFYPDALE